MSQTLSDEAAIADARVMARSTLYSTFAKFLSHPTKEVLDTLGSGQFEANIEDLMSEAGYRVTSRERFRATGSARDIEIFYASAFEAGLPKVSLREANYIRDGEKILFEDLFRFYDHFGLDTSSGALREWPDHIAVELEFMHYLTWLEAGADKSANPFRLAQKDFLSRHLSHWVGALADRLEQKGTPPPWPQVARLLADFVAAESSRLEAS